MRKMLPAGMDSFEKIRRSDCYYVDKTGMIAELLHTHGDVNLFTRPRRFGKSINISMLKSFFEIGTDKSLFDGLAIAKDTGLCEKFLGQYPVIFVTLKEVFGINYDSAVRNLWEEISREAARFSFLADSDKLTSRDKRKYQDLCNETGNVEAGLKQLSSMLYRHYGRQVIILIDEYDAPLQKAYENGYYDKMVLLIRQLFGYALKSNDSLLFSVLTGCMRVSKESIFSDLNNPVMYTLTDNICEEWFGFTDEEVRCILQEFALEQYYETTREWYDGYQIGATRVYCPRDVICWCRQLLLNNGTYPKNYWENVSENKIVYRLVEASDAGTKHDLETLSEGLCIDKRLLTDLTYRDMDEDVESLWSVLFTAGYLTQRGERSPDGIYHLTIPNREVFGIFKREVQRWFKNTHKNRFTGLYEAFEKGDPKAVQDQLDSCMRESISFFDGGNTDEQKESFYHGMLIGITHANGRWVVKSNRESGKGRSDLAIVNPQKRLGILIEVKYSKTEEELPEKLKEARGQIDRMQYEDFFLVFGIKTVIEYGAAFYNKMCSVEKN
ncbi:MAG: ATP-binding protein [Lachnospiraceae bacterium]|nr:ATP-binding protein [Lachnospiraceae bacterium]